MATEIIDRAYLEIDGTEFVCQEVTRNTELDGAKVVNGMTRNNEGIGHANGNLKYEISAKIPCPEDGSLTTLEEAMKAETEFSTTVEYEGGQTRTIEDCRIYSFNQGASHGEESTADVTIQGLSQGIN